MKTFTQFLDVAYETGRGKLDGIDAPYKNLILWKSQAEHRGFKVSSATHPKTGEADKYFTAKDKEGNHKGEFEVK